MKFVAGEILTPMVVPPPPLTLEEKIKRLESDLAESGATDIPASTWTAQLDVLKDAWRCKKLDAGYFEEWLDAKLCESQKEPEKPEVEGILLNNFNNFRTEILLLLFISDKPILEGSQDQVIDMVLDNSDSEESAPSQEAAVVESNPAEELDSALSSFYTDLAELDAAVATVAPATREKSPPPPPPPPAANNVEVLAPVEIANNPAPSTVNPSEPNEEEAPELVKGIKRAKMSSDMTSLVAKWQKINQQSSGT